MNVLIVTPQEILFEGAAHQVELPGEDGALCVLGFHQAFVYRLTKGSIVIDGAGAIAVEDGLARMVLNELTVFVRHPAKNAAASGAAGEMGVRG